MAEKQNNVALSVQHVSKSFKLPHERINSIKNIFTHPFRRRSYEKQEALKNINFEVKKGEFFGIIGKNGSGKSTMLKLLAGIYSPDEGRIGVNGKLVPFIELGVGFNPELTGRENVFLNGALLGFTRKEMLSMYDEIVEFAELEKFMDQKLKNYSSGMQVRLAFSIAIRAKGDILLLDEVLAVGDMNFQEKCFEYFAELKAEKKTVILVSHDRNALEKYCERGILINEGKVVAEGSMSEMLKEYNSIILENIKDDTSPVKNEKISTKSSVMISAVMASSKTSKSRKFAYGERITISFTAEFAEEVENPIFGITLWDAGTTKPLIATNTFIERNKTGIIKKGSKINFSVQLPNNLNDSKYYYEVAVANSSGTIMLATSSREDFRVSGSDNPYSILSFESKINLKAAK